MSQQDTDIAAQTDGQSQCLFCRIASGQIPAEQIASNEHALAFADIDPQAPTHVLVIPRAHHENLAAVAAADPQAAAGMISLAAHIAQKQGRTDYRLVANTGEQAGQSVFHAHLHVLGGRDMTWPPG